MSYRDDLFNYLKPFPYIFVTGPQRSGTTIAAYMISQDLGYDFFHEEHMTSAIKERIPAKVEVGKFIQAYNHSPHPPPWAGLMGKNYTKFVVQCPALCSIVHKWIGIENIAVVMMIRPVADIIASEKRISWGFEEWEKGNYPGQSGPISKIKYDFWHSTQKNVLADQGFELEYESLCKHPLWANKEQRKGFGSRQIAIGKTVGQIQQLGGKELG